MKSMQGHNLARYLTGTSLSSVRFRKGLGNALTIIAAYDAERDRADVGLAGRVTLGYTRAIKSAHGFELMGVMYAIFMCTGEPVDMSVVKRVYQDPNACLSYGRGVWYANVTE